MFRNIKTQNPTYDELDQWQKLSGLPLERFFNTSGSLYRQLGLKEKLPQMSREEKLRQLSLDGMLVRRPIAVWNQKVKVGFKEDDWSELLQ